MLVGGIRPHLYCLPILKVRIKHRQDALPMAYFHTNLLKDCCQCKLLVQIVVFYEGFDPIMKIINLLIWNDVAGVDGRNLHLWDVSKRSTHARLCTMFKLFSNCSRNFQIVQEISKLLKKITNCSRNFKIAFKYFNVRYFKLLVYFKLKKEDNSKLSTIFSTMFPARHTTYKVVY